MLRMWQSGAVQRAENVDGEAAYYDGLKAIGLVNGALYRRLEVQSPMEHQC